MSRAERAPAKTNLFLEVRGRRPDGFHELDTVFVELALADELTATPRPDDALVLEVAGEGAGGAVPAGPENLVWRAADALRRRAGRPELGATLRLTKRIPAGGGLGGGSSDAAAALRALDEAWKLRSDPAALAELAAGLGSDVPFFLAGGVQRGRGRGELLEPLSRPARPLELVLLLPPFPCPTPQVYRALAPHLPTEPRGPEALLAALASGDPAEVGAALFNRLEAPAFALFPALAELKQELEALPGVVGALLSGSGSTLLGVARDGAAAAGALEALRARGHRALLTQTPA